jgi:tetratricopeptide (TPR) repeat protein
VRHRIGACHGIPVLACVLLAVLAFARAAHATQPPGGSGASPPVATAAAVGAAAEEAAVAATSSAEERFEDANAAFAAGRYEEAVAGFQSIVAADGYSPALLFDLANAYLRAGRLGEAILWYERARLLAPRDPDIQANLRQARRAANLPLPPEGDAWSRLEERASPDGWTIVASAALFVAAALAIAARLGRARARRGSGMGRLLAIAVGASLIVAAGAALLAATRLRAFDRAVILGADPSLRVAPYEEATVSSALDPGELVRIERDHQGFRLVRAEDGRSGWVREDSAEPIVPR